ncbi:MAG: PEP-CTERM sorting domain-containing protein [Coleofasciculus sp. C1-SOL-03]|jgi:hypothetical protein|uniref:PEP-CTERM sorting domain-containing protein n=1 Tax=Coleofasciculus sp. C1-SOL-03 TaxID=3069522 RepID=UPI0032FCA4AF
MRLKKTSTVLGLAVGSALVLSAMPAGAVTFGNDSIQFDQDTEVTFDFTGSNGKFGSMFGVVLESDPDNIIPPVLFAEDPAFDPGPIGDFQGTCGVVVPDPCTATFTFLAGETYSLALKSDNGTVYSTDSLNPVDPANPASPQTRQFAFFQDETTLPPLTNESGEGSVDPFDKFAILIEDKGGSRDFNDFRLTAMATETDSPASIPEPATLAGLGLVAGSLTLMRRRQANKKS